MDNFDASVSVANDQLVIKVAHQKLKADVQVDLAKLPEEAPKLCSTCGLPIAEKGGVMDDPAFLRTLVGFLGQVAEYFSGQAQSIEDWEAKHAADDHHDGHGGVSVDPPSSSC